MYGCYSIYMVAHIIIHIAHLVIELFFIIFYILVFILTKRDILVYFLYFFSKTQEFIFYINKHGNLDAN